MTTSQQGDEWVQLRFQEALQSRRRRLLRFVLAMGVFVVAGVIGGLVDRESAWNRVAAVVILVSWIFGVAVLIGRRVRCPKCNAKVEGTVGRLCPECGAGGVEKVNWYQRPFCTSCGTRFSWGRRGGGNWIIKYCTHCGVRLHDAGARL